MLFIIKLHPWRFHGSSSWSEATIRQANLRLLQTQTPHYGGYSSILCRKRNHAVKIVFMVRSFVIHEHSGWGRTHYDLMLDDGQSLATWQIMVSPSEIGQAGRISATKLPDHRRAYLDYQGPVSKGRGTVTPVDKGACEVIHRSDDLWRVNFRGQVFSGIFELACQEDGSWLLYRA
jgi:hypothetical protein